MKRPVGSAYWPFLLVKGPVSCSKSPLLWAIHLDPIRPSDTLSFQNFRLFWVSLTSFCKNAMSLPRVPLNRYITFFSLAILGLAADLLSKQWSFDKLGLPGQSPPMWIWQGYAGFETSLNEGAMFGMGQGWVNFFAALSFVALLGILYWLFVAKAALDGWLNACLGMITAGVLGNLYDRLGLHGLLWTAELKPEKVGQPIYAVRDFILVQAGDQWRWPNFNIADSFLVCGAGLLIFLAMRAPKEAEQNTPAKAEKAAAPKKRNVA